MLNCIQVNYYIHLIFDKFQSVSQESIKFQTTMRGVKFWSSLSRRIMPVTPLTSAANGKEGAACRLLSHHVRTNSHRKHVLTGVR